VDHHVGDPAPLPLGLERADILGEQGLGGPLPVALGEDLHGLAAHLEAAGERFRDPARDRHMGAEWHLEPLN
jgi:hypothetical protein